MRKANEAESMRGSLNSTMGEPLVARNKQAYSGHRELPIALDAVASGAYAQRRLLSEFQLRGSIFYPCNPPARHRERSGEAGGCVWRSQTRAKKTQGFNVLNESAAGGR